MVCTGLFRRGVGLPHRYPLVSVPSYLCHSMLTCGLHIPITYRNCRYSSRCGKNMSRMIVPGNGAVTPPTFERQVGSRSIPSGRIYMPTTMARPPYTAMSDKALTCEGKESKVTN